VCSESRGGCNPPLGWSRNIPGHYFAVFYADCCGGVAVWLSGNALVSINVRSAGHYYGYTSLRTGKPSRCITRDTGQLSLAIPPWLGAISSLPAKAWDQTGTPRDVLDPVSVVSQCKQWGQLKLRSAPRPVCPCSLLRTMLCFVLPWISDRFNQKCNGIRSKCYSDIFTRTNATVKHKT